MSSEPRRLGQVIRDARVGPGRTQDARAARIGVRQRAVSFWENGAETPRIDHVTLPARELPAIIASFDGRVRLLLERVVPLERGLCAGRCSCKDCTCGKDEG